DVVAVRALGRLVAERALVRALARARVDDRAMVARPVRLVARRRDARADHAVAGGAVLELRAGGLRVAGDAGVHAHLQGLAADGEGAVVADDLRVAGRAL